MSILISVLFVFLNVNAQEGKNTGRSSITTEDETSEKEKYQPFQITTALKNMHLWRGFRSTDEALTTTQLYYISKNKNFTAGFWTGVSFTGNYTEFDYYITYKYENWSFSIWDINNYSNYPDADVFNYDIGDTSRYLDLLITYSFDKMPIQLTWSTIFLGRDTYNDRNGNLKNAFSSYAEISYSLIDNSDSNLGVFVGGAFSFKTEANFYGPRTGFCNIGLAYSKSLKIIGEYNAPVSAKAMWNNLQEYGAFEVAVNLF